MIIGIVKEICPDERRVALSPANVTALRQRQLQVLIEPGAGEQALYQDQAYQDAGASLSSREEIFQRADIIVQVQTPGLNLRTGEEDFRRLRAGQILIGMMDPLARPEFAQELADRDISGFAMELIPRISRAQSMDVLSTNAVIAGYKAVLLGASHCPQMFPMNMTAAGTLKPARVFVMGAGVAGLQACATAKRLGAVVEAYDVRPAAREQILSVGAKPIEINIDSEQSETAGGYAKEQSADFIARQQAAMADILAHQDVVITTAAVPGKRSPVLITEEMVKAMKAGAVIIDLACEKGGNCALTQLDEVIVAHGVTIVGPQNLTSSVPHHASQMYGKNIENFLSHLFNSDGHLNLDLDDEIIRDTLVSQAGQVSSPRLRELLQLTPLFSDLEEKG